MDLPTGAHPLMSVTKIQGPRHVLQASTARFERLLNFGQHFTPLFPDVIAPSCPELKTNRAWR
ncbi:MAG: hypothetical protein LC679_07245, partial [Intrasporangiaceae bacterium]|nr:hypothetical protein [Intrasporangiaceae bacterium]